MRRGIGLRGYAQQDPLNEFRKEAFQLYEELQGLIRHQVASTIFRVTVTRQPPAQPLGAAGGAGSSSFGSGTVTGAGSSPGSATTVGSGGARPIGPLRGLPGAGAARAMQESLGERVVGGAGAAAGGVKPGFTPAGARIGRNDTCYCGSGLKYKKCHGR
jgi:preprotein translocase subunit SecA